ncbi:MAG: hypothetical protein HY294_02540 [Candidatus Rokubacteria bacterium]|nr:hypothetical protein [Candidatus Rokubacteria bacterium]
METRPGRLLFAPSSQVLAHVGRSVILARELARRGHRIAFAGVSRYLDDPTVVRPGEFEIHPLPDFDLAEGLEILRTIRKVPDRADIDANLAAELALLDRVRPDAVVVDFRPTMFLSARLRGIPVVSLVNGRWLYPYAARPYRGFRNYAAYDVLRRLVGRRGADLLMPPLFRLVLRHKIRPFARAFRRYGLPPRRQIWDLITGELTLVLDTELLSPMAGLPENFRMVGPIQWSPPVALPAWVEGLRGKPIVYVTLGSTGHPDLFRYLLRALGGTPFEVLMSTGGQLDLAPAEVPENVHVAKFLPGDLSAELAEFVIHHGGAGTVYQTLAAGKPSIVIATHFEQELLGAALEEHGAAIFLVMREVARDPALLRDAIRRMVEGREAYRAGAARLQKDLQGYNGVATAADAIAQYLAR